MNLSKVKLGDRIIVCTDHNGETCPAPGNLDMQATVIGISSNTVLLGWNGDDGFRPNNASPMSWHAISSAYQYIKSFSSYTYFLGTAFESPCVAAIGISIDEQASEWMCMMPACKKMNDNTAKTCYMCGTENFNGKR